METHNKLRLEGAHRACSPKETLARMRPYYEQAGITRVSEITGLDRIGISVAQCIRPDAVVLSVDSGKGATQEAAQCSAVMEGFERHVAETCELTAYRGTAHEMGNIETHFPRIRGSVFNYDTPINWTKVYGIKSRAPVYVPEDVVRMTLVHPVFPLFAAPFVSTSNGLSSGNTLEEAICGGLYEVIERDQVHCCIARDSLGIRVDLDTVEDQTLIGLITTLRVNCVIPVLFDCTLDLGVPTYMAYLYDVERGLGIYRGYAAHLDPAVAQCRAICEAVQARLVWMSGSRDDWGSQQFAKSKTSDNTETITSLMAGKETVSSTRHPDNSTDSFKGDIDIVLGLLEAAGIPEPLLKVYDHPYPCSVVKVLVPTLEGYYGKLIQTGARGLSL